MHHPSLWRRTAGGAEFGSLQGHVDAESAIIGGGITGLTAALRLTEAGKRVVVLEADRIGSGTTAHSSCHLTTQIGFAYRNMRRKFGDDTARAIAQSRRAGIDYIEGLSADPGFACDFRRLPGYLYSERGTEDMDILRQEAEAASEAGLEARFVERAPLSFAGGGAVLFGNQAAFNGQGYLDGLARRLATMGCRIYEKSRAASAGKFLKSQIDVSKNFLGDRMTAGSRLEDLAPGQGGLVRVGDEHLAVYRDEAGKAQAVSPVCPHMGCLVHWNPEEKTWDCPCHGSRYETDGSLITGPATEGLEAKEIPQPEEYRKTS